MVKLNVNEIECIGKALDAFSAGLSDQDKNDVLKTFTSKLTINDFVNNPDKVDKAFADSDYMINSILYSRTKKSDIIKAKLTLILHGEDR